MPGGEELRALGGFFQLADLAAGRGAGQLGQRLGSRWPAIRRPVMSRPVTPCRPVSTAEILIAADSSSFSARCFSRVRSSVRSRRYRVCSRMIRNSGVATKHAVTAPRSKHAAGHRQSAGSRLAGRAGS